jgi:hypothetical protein
VFVRVNSPTVHPFFSSDRRAASRVSSNAMLRVTLMSHCTTRQTTMFSKSLIVIVCRLLRVTVPVALFGSSDHTVP